MIEYSERRDKRIFEILDLISEVENVYFKTKRAVDIVSPLSWKIGQDVVEKSRKLCIEYEIWWGEFLFLIENEKSKKLIEKLNSFKEKLEKAYEELKQKLSS